MEYSRKRSDLTGQRFGRLTVLAPAENVHGRTAWRCRCDCGNERVVQSRRLKDGHVTSCGCAKREQDENALSLHYIDGTCLEMLRKNTKRCNNTSGVVGVDWREDKKLWRASICFKGKRYYLGGYKNLSDAVAARKKAEQEMHVAFVASMTRLEQEPVH